ncbi:hypothetical protein ABIE44_001817 [Marmoricola sp. OAE513]|uniref:hypothetical protein n=1 Tax=Marmoricola sp. OAE513 TaxID=2817894 RepID=UPI00339516C3
MVALAGDVDATGSKAPGLLVRGGIYANGSVKGLVNVIAGGVRATGSCDATVTASPKLCGGGVTPVPDPNYSSELGNTVPDLRTPPTSCTSGVAIFEPGYYDNAKKLNAATNLCSTAWFKPGDYYFDFHDQACANVCPDNVFDASSNVWTISGKTVVGGTPVDANGNNLAQLPSGATVPGACRNPITNVNTKGVQFVFGGSSRIYIDQKSDVELCATYHPDRPPIAIYGLKSGQTPTATAATGLTLGTVQASGSFGGTATPTSLAPGGSVASWTTSNANAQTTTLTVKGFTPGGATPPPVPGAILQSAKLRITHKDADGTANSASSAKLTIGSSTTAAIAVPASVSTTTTELVFDGSTNAAIFNSLQTEVHDNGFGNVAVAYTANAKKLNGVTEVDAITFDLTYYLPVLRSQVGTCIDGTAPACLFLDMKNGNNMTKAYVQGTTYVPKGDLQMLLGNAASEIMKFGVVARQVSLQFWNGNSSQTDPVIEVPSDSPGFGFETTLVRLSVYVCSGSTCSVDPANLALRSRVKIFDEGGTPGPGHRQMSILNWDHTR